MLDEAAANEAGERGWSSWETFFQASGGALASMDSAGSILNLENRVEDALALSFLPFEALVDVDDWEGSTAQPAGFAAKRRITVASPGRAALQATHMARL